METIARRVNGQRRVGLPCRMARWSGIRALHWVEVRAHGRGKKSLRVVPVPPPSAKGDMRDASRPRMVTKVWQVTLPKEWMDQAGWSPGQWVSLTSLGANKGLRLSAQGAPSPGPFSDDYRSPLSYPDARGRQRSSSKVGTARHRRRASNPMVTPEQGK